MFCYTFLILCDFLSFHELRFSHPWEQFFEYIPGNLLLSLSVSILYGIITLLLPMDISNLAVSINQFLFMHTELILTVSISSSVYSCDTSCSISLTILLLLLCQTFWKCSILLHSMHVCCLLGIALAGGSPHSIYMAVVVWSSTPVFLLCLILHFWISLFCRIVLTQLMYLVLLLGPYASLLSWPILIHLHLLCCHHF